MANLYVKAVPPADLNRNTEWFMYPGVWTTYILILFFSWLLVLSVLGCSPGMAWTIVNLSHFVVYGLVLVSCDGRSCDFLNEVTYHFFHWKKGTPFADDQGIYNGLTWWEQIDSGKQLTRNRKFLTVVPVVLDGAGDCQVSQHAQVEKFYVSGVARLYWEESSHILTRFLFIISLCEMVFRSVNLEFVDFQPFQKAINNMESGRDLVEKIVYEHASPLDTRQRNVCGSLPFKDQKEHVVYAELPTL
ncbi:hypothetical protein FEM48_Zijuj08G0038200 [Ziziphus jujuba var. spinosa]|uniref:Uncharacterized protein n=1 Tax=Ziziphus jujuba var. spinosa TaxID=714518 RepID=A0A978UWU1_ZIZJJ|nr:hypothetical protein FEM48_Zijuj08G0038200 [Ziziphus jujuba var. spinosa]